MRVEKDIVPYHTSELPPGPWVVFAPHADDETFGMGGPILRARAADISVTVVVVTDGAQGGNEPDLVETRRQEAREAMSRLGVDDLRFLEVPDRHLDYEEGGIEKCRQILESLEPRAVFFTAPVDLHPDHRGLAAVLWEAKTRLNRPGIEFYAYEVGIQAACNLLIDITSTIDQKIEAIQAYTSQLGQNDYLEHMLAMNKSRTYTLPPTVTYAEAFYHFRPGTGGLLTWQHCHDAACADGVLPHPLPAVSLVLLPGVDLAGPAALLDCLARQNWSNLEVLVPAGEDSGFPDALLREYSRSLPGLRRISLSGPDKAVLPDQLNGEWVGVLSTTTTLHDDALMSLMSLGFAQGLDAVGSPRIDRLVDPSGHVISLGEQALRDAPGQNGDRVGEGWLLRREWVARLDLSDPVGIVLKMDARRSLRPAVFPRPLLHQRFSSVDAWLEEQGSSPASERTDSEWRLLLQASARVGEEYNRFYGYIPHMQAVEDRLAAQMDEVESLKRSIQGLEQRMAASAEASKAGEERLREALDVSLETQVSRRLDQLATQLDSTARQLDSTARLADQWERRWRRFKRVFGLNLVQSIFRRDKPR